METVSLAPETAQPSAKNLSQATELGNSTRVSYLRAPRRRVNLNTSRGARIESGRLFKDYRDGRIDRASYLAQVKGLAEHREHLKLEREDYVLSELDERLRRLEQEPARAPLFDALEEPAR